MTEIKKMLKKGKLLVGTMVSELRNPNIVYMLAQCGFDFIIIDCEHGAYSSESVSDIIAASRGAGIPVIVRIPEIRREAILKPLDSGAAGLLVPQVNTGAQAKEVIKHAKYLPMGNRGVGLRRAHSLYSKVNATDYLKKANEETFISLQAENPTAIKNLEEIVSVPGIDSIFVGPMDLSVSLGVPGQVTHPEEEKAIDRILKVCLNYHVIAGIMMFNLDSLKTWIRKGIRFVVYSSDISLLADMASASVKELKDVIDT
jgi:2-keto-3-deoxy-L-rhamnonate aldolase RhmA